MPTLLFINGCAVYLKEHETSVGAKFAAHHSRMFINGLASVLRALQRTVRCTVIEDLFAKCGIYPYCPSVILANCTAKISADESTKILCAIPDLAKILLRNGEISDADFDKIGIRNNEDTYKDNSHIPRRRGVIMTNVEVSRKNTTMREANRTSGKRSKKTNKQVVTSKKLRVESTEAAEREPLLLRVPLPTDSA